MSWFSKSESSPNDVLTEVNEEALKVGRKLAELRESEGFQLLIDLIDKRVLEIGNLALDDEKRPREYYQGFRAGAGGLKSLVDQIIAQATEELERQVTEEKLHQHFGINDEGGALAE